MGNNFGQNDFFLKKLKYFHKIGSHRGEETPPPLTPSLTKGKGENNYHTFDVLAHLKHIWNKRDFSPWKNEINFHNFASTTLTPQKGRKFSLHFWAF